LIHLPPDTLTGDRSPQIDEAQHHVSANSEEGSVEQSHVVPTDEELMIARHTVALLSTARDP
jgi:acetate kinase